jgi:hypothetical protein
MLDNENFMAHDYVSYSGNQLTITRNPHGFINRKQNSDRRNLKMGGTRRVNMMSSNSRLTLRKQKVDKDEYILLPQMQYKSDFNLSEQQGGDNESFSGYSGVVFSPNSSMTDTKFISRIKDILKNNDINVIDTQMKLNKCLPDISETFNNML